MTVKDLAEKLNEIIKQGKGDYEISLNCGEYCYVTRVEVIDEDEYIDIG